MRVAPKNVTSLQSVLHIQKFSTIEGDPVSEVIERLAYNFVRNTSDLNEACFVQQISNAPSGIPSREGEKGSKMPKMIDLS